MAAPQFKSSLVRWIDRRLPVFTYIHHEYHEFPMPRNLTYLWSFGALATIMLVIMLVTGIVLAMHYTANVDLAFGSVERIMREVNYGWLLRYLHSNGASMFFLVVYIHIFRGLYYGSYKEPRELLWILGVLILLLMMATAFMGYVLPWGQQSFWAATVITNLFTAIPLIGESITTWLWGGFSVDNPTLTRFYALHYLLPFVIVGVVALHVVALHVHGSNNPIGIDTRGPQDTVPFHPFFTSKDSVAIMGLMLVYAGFVFYGPNTFLHPDNYIPANPLVTPSEIVPEWYLMPFYAILRSVPDKLGGVVLMFGSILVLFFVPWLDTSRVRSARFRPIYRWLCALLLVDVLVLLWAGGRPPEGSALVISRVATTWYFLHFLILLPLVGKIERPRQLPDSIRTPVLGAGGGAGQSATTDRVR